MDGLHPTLKAIIKKKLPVKMRRQETALLREVDDQTRLEPSCRDINTVISYVSHGHRTQTSYRHDYLPLEHRQLIDMLLRGRSTVEQVQVLQAIVRNFNEINERPRTD